MPNENISCSNCGRTESIDLAVVNTVTGGHICSSCTDVLLFQSCIDDLYYPRSMRVKGDAGWMTQEQKDEEHDYESCPCCGERTLTEDMISYTDRYGDILSCCQNCEDDETFWCDYNNERYSTDVESQTVSVGGDFQTWCNDAVQDDARLCNETHEYYHIDEMVFHQADEEWYHENEVPEPEDEVPIMNYFYSPSLHLNSVKNENIRGRYMKRDAPYLGVEIEVDTPNLNYREVANECTLLANGEQQTYCKEDSSTDGFEIITQPMTFEYHKQFGWRKILKQIHDAGGRGYDSGDCGIHVHVTKKSYSPLTWWKVIEFTWKCKSFIKRFAQRNGRYRYCRYLSPSEYRGYDNRKDTYPSNPHERQVALNFGDRHPTAEFRIFRSTTQHERFWASIEFTYAVIQFCNSHGYASIIRYDSEKVWGMFVLYLHNSTQHRTLLKHFSKRQLTNNALCV
jgi:hypothetical protein